jgi:hypothetical protein
MPPLTWIATQLSHNKPKSAAEDRFDDLTMPKVDRRLKNATIDYALNNSPIISPNRLLRIALMI